MGQAADNQNMHTGKHTLTHTAGHRGHTQGIPGTQEPGACTVVSKYALGDSHYENIYERGSLCVIEFKMACIPDVLAPGMLQYISRWKA